MPAVVQHLAGWSTALDVASAGEMQVALDTRHAADPDQLRRPGQDDRRAARRPSPPACSSSSSRRGEADRLVARRRPGSAYGPRVAVRVNPDFAVKGSGMRMGGGPQQFGSTPSDVPGAARATSADRDVDLAGLPRLRRLAEPQRRDPRRGAARAPSTSLLRLADKAHAAGDATSTSAAASASPTSTRTSRSTSRGSASDLARAAGRRACAPALPRRRVVIELGRYLVGECGVYVTRVVDRKVSRGHDVRRRRRRHAPPARRLGQLRPGHPAQLPARGRQPARAEAPTRTAHGRRLPVHAARPARHDVGSRRRRSATSSSSSRPAPTA